MFKTQRLTRQFMQLCDLQTSEIPTTGIAFKKLTAIVTEEYQEFIRAMDVMSKESDTAQFKEVRLKICCDVIDAICDLIVVLHNTTNAMGIDIEPFFEEVHKTNMKKEDGPKRDDGKQLKPKGWEPPDHESILRKIIGVPIWDQFQTILGEELYEMNLDEAINEADSIVDDDASPYCNLKHKQLVSWLVELKLRREKGKLDTLPEGLPFAMFSAWLKQVQGVKEDPWNPPGPITDDGEPEPSVVEEEKKKPEQTVDQWNSELVEAMRGSSHGWRETLIAAVRDLGSDWPKIDRLMAPINDLCWARMVASSREEKKV